MEKIGLYKYLQQSRTYSLSGRDYAVYSLTKKGLDFRGCSWDPVFVFRKEGNSWILDTVKTSYRTVDEVKEFLEAITVAFGPSNDFTDYSDRNFPYGRPMWNLGPKGKPSVYVHSSAPLLPGEIWVVLFESR